MNLDDLKHSAFLTFCYIILPGALCFIIGWSLGLLAISLTLLLR
jgi:hypothetical protein